jgi:hypothetical protein
MHISPLTHRYSSETSPENPNFWWCFGMLGYGSLDLKKFPDGCGCTQNVDIKDLASVLPATQPKCVNLSESERCSSNSSLRGVTYGVHPAAGHLCSCIDITSQLQSYFPLTSGMSASLDSTVSSHHYFLGISLQDNKIIANIYQMPFYVPYINLIFFASLGFEFRASHLLGRHSYRLSYSTSPFLWWGLAWSGFELQSSCSLPPE